MTVTVFSAAVTNVLADEDDGEEKTVVSLNPCVATNEFTWTIATTFELIEEMWPGESYSQEDIDAAMWGWDNYWQTKWVSRWWGGYYTLKSCQEIAKGRYK
ncbi:MAG: hypothetical protein QMC80_02890 [Thermoplasmatales archaeon]|nr:hypothetical protein [Thermoplasmatales archaeon]